MVAPLIAAAGIAAAGSVISGITGGKGAKKQAKIAQQSQREQIAAIDRNREYQYGLNAPSIERGTGADSRIAALLGLGGDAAGSQAAFDEYRRSTGYDTRLQEALSATNQRAFAGGMGQSGAALKALQTRGADVAGRYFDTYLGQLGGVSAGGQNARGLVAGVGGQGVNQFMNANQTGTAQQIAASQAGTANTQSMIQNLVNAANFGLGSSYGGLPSSTPTSFDPTMFLAKSASSSGRLGW